MRGNTMDLSREGNKRVNKREKIESCFLGIV
jgi:hypothetical protein